MDILNEETIRDKLHYYSDRNIPVHITLNILMPNGKNKFHNGQVIKYFDNFVEFEDEVKGNIPLFFRDIKDVEKREGKR
jgi:hypothetical protein